MHFFGFFSLFFLYGAVVCLYKSWGSPTSAKLSLAIGSVNDLENSVDRGRYVHQREERLPDGNVENEVANDHRVVGGVGDDGLDEEHESRLEEMHEAKKQILELQRKIQELEARIPRKYPDVTFLNYKNRKRILVSVD